MLARHQVKFQLAHGGDAPPASCSKRFETTTRTGLESVNARRHEVPNRARMAAELRQRKVNNTKTSIALGSTPMLYETDAQAHQKDILGGQTAGADKERNRRLKAQLTRTTFCLGEEPAEYEPVSTLPDPTGHLSDYTGVLNKDVKDMMKRSNMYFGNAAPSYSTAAHEGMRAVGSAGIPLEELQRQRQHNRELKVALTRTNFNFGDEVPEYVSDYKRGFLYDQEEVRKIGRAGLAQEVKDDLRKTHFQFGTDNVVWETDVRRNMRAAGEVDYKTTMDELARQREHNRLLKQSLQRTNYSIGNDADYM